MELLEDTQPTAPISEPPPEFIRPEEEDGEPGGPGCFVWMLIGALILGVSLMIVLLAALAGWTSGQRTAQTNATVTQNARIDEQLSRLPGDVASGNLAWVEIRVDALASMTPGLPQVPDLIQTATAVYLTYQPTPTPMPTTTPVTAEATEETAIVPQSASGDYDLPALLQEAQAAISVRDWPAAIELLDVIIALDGSFERANVRSLISQALNSYARELFQSGKLAEAILITDRAEQFGALADGLNFERYVAAFYLDAVNSLGINYPAAIRALRQVYDLSPNYRNGEVAQLLFDQYVAYGDALAQQGDQCSAAAQYEGALSVLSSSAISDRRDTASTLCALGTPTPDPNVTPGTQPSIAPVGVPGG